MECDRCPNPVMTRIEEDGRWKCVCGHEEFDDPQRRCACRACDKSDEVNKRGVYSNS